MKNLNDSYVTLPAKKVREMCQRTLKWINEQREMKVRRVAQKLIDQENAFIDRWAGWRKFFLLRPHPHLTLDDGIETLKILTKNWGNDWGWDYYHATNAYSDEREAAIRLFNATIPLKDDEDMFIGTKDLQVIQ